MKNFCAKSIHSTMFSSTNFSFLMVDFSYYYIAFASKETICPFEYIYQFGDSLADTGNRIRQVVVTSVFNVSSLPCGITYFHKPTCRFSNGLLVIDFVAKALDLPLLHPHLETNASFSNGVNFAVRGSTALNNSFFFPKEIFLYHHQIFPLASSLNGSRNISCLYQIINHNGKKG